MSATNRHLVSVASDDEAITTEIYQYYGLNHRILILHSMWNLESVTIYGERLFRIKLLNKRLLCFKVIMITIGDIECICTKKNYLY
jgi:hypothetical protein